MEPLVMIGAPVRNREWILPKYLEHLYNLDYPKKNIVMCFIINDSKDRSDSILIDFIEKHGHEYKQIYLHYHDLGQIEDARIQHVRLQIYDSLAKLRNMLLEQARDSGVEYLFSVDSDILVPPNALKDLINSGKQVISAQIWNDLARMFPNILKKDTKGNIRHYMDFPKNSIFKCHTTGAAYLLDKDAFTRCSYKNDPQGEDVGFCRNAESLGIEVWCNSNVYCRHIMSQIQLQIKSQS